MKYTRENVVGLKFQHEGQGTIWLIDSINPKEKVVLRRAQCSANSSTDSSYTISDTLRLLNGGTWIEVITIPVIINNYEIF